MRFSLNRYAAHSLIFDDVFSRKKSDIPVTGLVRLATMIRGYCYTSVNNRHL